MANGATVERGLHRSKSGCVHLCYNLRYDQGMRRVGIRELRNQVAAVVRRAGDGIA